MCVAFCYPLFFWKLEISIGGAIWAGISDFFELLDRNNQKFDGYIRCVPGVNIHPYYPKNKFSQKVKKFQRTEATEFLYFLFRAFGEV